MPKKPKKEIDESQILRDTFAREQQTVTKFLAECKSDLEKTMSVEKMPELHRKLDVISILYNTISNTHISMIFFFFCRNFGKTSIKLLIEK